MIYSINKNQIEIIKGEDINTSKLTCISLTLEQLKEYQNELKVNERVIENFEKHQTYYRTALHEYDEYTYGVINVLDVKNLKSKIQIGFIIKDNLFILVQLSNYKDSIVEESLRKALQKIKGQITLEKVIYELADSLIRNVNDVLTKIDNEVMVIEAEIIDDNIDKNLNKEIFKYRNKLSIMKNYYEQLIDCIEDLQGIDMFEENECMFLNIFINKCERICLKIQELSEEFIHVREALDATLDYKLNKNMNIFTVVTTIFLPLTLIVGWYGMNFKFMPELNWKYGYISVIILSIIIVIGCLTFFKKKKLL